MKDQSIFGNLFISAGAMKAGTTWLFSIFQNHPELFFTCEKEIHYFYARFVDKSVLSETRRLELAKSRYIDTINPEAGNIDRIRLNLHWVSDYLNRPVDDFWYANLFSAQRSETYRCDFSNLYAHLPVEAWRHIEANSCKLRVLYTLRHPVRRLWSHLKFHLTVIDKIDLLDSWSPEDYNAFVRKPFIWENAEYGAILRRMKQGLSGNSVKTVFFEDVHNSPKEVISGIEKFLNIKQIPYKTNDLNKKVNQSTQRRMPDFFPGLFEKDIHRIKNELKEEGLILPQSWQNNI